MAPPATATLLGESKAARSAHPSAGVTPKPPATVRESKTETRRRGDSVAQSSRYVPSHSRAETNRDTLRPTERRTERGTGHGTERDRTHRPSERETRRGDSTMNSMQSKFDNMSIRGSRAPRTERENRDLETSTAATTKAGSMIGSDAVNASRSKHGTHRDRTTRFDNVPTIYEDEEVFSRAPASRYDTIKSGDLVPYDTSRAPASRFESVKSGHLVPYDSKSTIGGGSLFNGGSRVHSRACSSYNSGATTRVLASYAGDNCTCCGDEAALTRRDDKTFSRMMRDEATKASTVGVQGMQVKVDTGNTKIEINILDVVKKR